jgi:hypothetical protein
VPGIGPAPVPSNGVDEAPRLCGVSSRLLGVAAVRLLLAAAGAVLAAARGLSADSTIAAVGAGAVLFVLLAWRRISAGLRDRPEPLAVPGDARFDPAWASVLRACLPSTAGVAALIVAALSVSAALAAVLAGVLAGLGVPALVGGGVVLARERAQGVRYWLECGPRARRFVSTR